MFCENADGYVRAEGGAVLILKRLEDALADGNNIMAVIAATVTPDANPVTMIFMYAVLLSLYEISLFVTRFVIIAREGKAGLKGSRVGFFSDEDDEE